MKNDNKDGATLIAEERARQLAEEGWDAEHDDKWRRDQLATAAACYALTPCMPKGARTGEWAPVVYGFMRWPWDDTCWKPCNETRQDRMRELTKAGALIAAEIDRLQRMTDEEYKD